MKVRECKRCLIEFVPTDEHPRSNFCSTTCRYATRRSYTDFTEKQLQEAVSTSTTWTEVCETVSNGIRTGSMHRKIRILCVKYNIDTSRLLYPLGRRSPANYAQRSLSDMLESNSTRSADLRIRLIKDGVKEAKCESCAAVEWLEESIPLELHHIDGNHHNNVLENLQILCCNCHALTPSWRKPFKRRV